MCSMWHTFIDMQAATNLQFRMPFSPKLSVDKHNLQIMDANAASDFIISDADSSCFSRPFLPDQDIPAPVGRSMRLSRLDHCVYDAQGAPLLCDGARNEFDSPRRTLLSLMKACRISRTPKFWEDEKWDAAWCSQRFRDFCAHKRSLANFAARVGGPQSTSAARMPDWEEEEWERRSQPPEVRQWRSEIDWSRTKVYWNTRDVPGDLEKVCWLIAIHS